MMTGEQDDLGLIEPWLNGIMARLQPGQRIRLAREIGRIIRKTNAARVMANIEPDGTAMAARRPRTDRQIRAKLKGRKRIRDRHRNGPMFRKIELAKNMVVRPGPDQVVLSFKPRVAKTAEVHHFGETAPVDPRIPNSIRIRYAARALLGFNEADRTEILNATMAWLEGQSIDL